MGGLILIYFARASYAELDPATTQSVHEPKKGATCGISPPLLAPTESPKRFPNRSFPRRCRGSPPVLLPVQRLPQPATAFPTPGAGCCFKATPSQGRAGGGEIGCGRARLGLDWCGILEQPHGRLLPAA